MPQISEYLIMDLINDHDISPYTSASWGDLNNDGLLDLYITHHQPARVTPCNEDSLHDYIYLNNGDGAFIDISYLLPENLGSGYGFGFIASWVDYDYDQDMDLIIFNDCRQEMGNRVLENLTPRRTMDFFYADVSTDLAFDDCPSGMGISVADYDDDGYYDIFLILVRIIFI